jgi:hypothetical protein
MPLRFSLLQLLCGVTALSVVFGVARYCPFPLLLVMLFAYLPLSFAVGWIAGKVDKANGNAKDGLGSR